MKFALCSPANRSISQRKITLDLKRDPFRTLSSHKILKVSERPVAG
jgi:hypothetical protein